MLSEFEDFFDKSNSECKKREHAQIRWPQKCHNDDTICEKLKSADACSLSYSRMEAIYESMHQKGVAPHVLGPPLWRGVYAVKVMEDKLVKATENNFKKEAYAFALLNEYVLFAELSHAASHAAPTQQQPALTQPSRHSHAAFMHPSRSSHVTLTQP